MAHKIHPWVRLRHWYPCASQDRDHSKTGFHIDYNGPSDFQLEAMPVEVSARIGSFLGAGDIGRLSMVSCSFSLKGAWNHAACSACLGVHIENCHSNSAWSSQNRRRQRTSSVTAPNLSHSKPKCTCCPSTISDSQALMWADLSDKIKRVRCYLASGSSHCIVLQGGSAFGFGNNYDGQLAFGQTTSDNAELSTFTMLPGVGGGLTMDPAASVACGERYSVVLSGRGEILSFGHFLGLGCGSRSHHVPKLVSLPERIMQVSCGEVHTLLVSQSGSVFAFGDGADGQLGLGCCSQGLLPSDGVVLEPLKVPFKEAVSFAAAGNKHSLIITRKQGRVYSCGNASSSQALGYSLDKIASSQCKCYESCYGIHSSKERRGSFPECDGGESAGSPCSRTCGDSLSPSLGSAESHTHLGSIRQCVFRQIESCSQAKSASCGACHSLVVTNDGQVLAFGQGGRGQLGLGSTETSVAPKSINFGEYHQEETVRVVKSTAGDFYSCLLLDNGMVAVFGDLTSCRIARRRSSSTIYHHPRLVHSLQDRIIVDIACTQNDFALFAACQDGRIFQVGPGWNNLNEEDLRREHGALSAYEIASGLLLNC